MQPAEKDASGDFPILMGISLEGRIGTSCLQ
jgi:hypothetical protein